MPLEFSFTAPWLTERLLSAAHSSSSLDIPTTSSRARRRQLRLTTALSVTNTPIQYSKPRNWPRLPSQSASPPACKAPCPSVNPTLGLACSLAPLPDLALKSLLFPEVEGPHQPSCHNPQRVSTSTLDCIPSIGTLRRCIATVLQACTSGSCRGSTHLRLAAPAQVPRNPGKIFFRYWRNSTDGNQQPQQGRTIQEIFEVHQPTSIPPLLSLFHPHLTKFSLHFHCLPGPKRRNHLCSPHQPPVSNLSLIFLALSTFDHHTYLPDHLTRDRISTVDRSKKHTRLRNNRVETHQRQSRSPAAFSCFATDFLPLRALV